MKKKWLLLPSVLLSLGQLYAQQFITEKKENASFTITGATQSATLLVDDKDHWLVQKATAFLQTDIESITGKKPLLQNTAKPSGKNIIIIGSVDQSSIISDLVKNKKIKHTI